MTVRTLTEIELDRIKFEAMDNVLGLGAVPYASIRNVYGIIQDNVQSSSVDPTTSSTAVTAAGAVTLTLASATGITAGTRVVLDVDDAREVVTVRNVAGSVISVVCAKTHAGTYPVEIESALTIVRGLLADLETLSQRERTLYTSAGVKSVDEIEFFGPSERGGALGAIMSARIAKRMELARASGIAWIVREVLQRDSGGGGFEVY
jgi:hypothetical protein